MTRGDNERQPVTNQVIPEAAVEAAAKAYRAEVTDGTHERALRAALEAAAPHMLAIGWDSGYAEGVREEQPGWTKNPYRPTP